MGTDEDRRSSEMFTQLSNCAHLSKNFIIFGRDEFW